MNIVDIQHVREITELSYVGYVCEPSAEAAAIQYEQKFKVTPDKAYRRVESNGKMSIYIPCSKARWMGHELEDEA